MIQSGPFFPAERYVNRFWKQLPISRNRDKNCSKRKLRIARIDCTQILIKIQPKLAKKWD